MTADIIILLAIVSAFGLSLCAISFIFCLIAFIMHRKEGGKKSLKYFLDRF